MTITNHVSGLFDLDEYSRMVDGGFVREQQHPYLPLTIANYTEHAQYEQMWNPVTLNCRGLIFDHDGMIVSRPYRKFFNYGDSDRTGPLDMRAPVDVNDKLDGSLGISYPVSPSGTPAVATRGSFTSDQALHATRLLRERYPSFRPLPGFTYLWEIIYPGNRIVVDYGDADELILHGVIHNATGTITTSDYAWTGPTARRFEYATLADALAAPPRTNAEGMVVRYLGVEHRDLMVKIKQDDYVALHRIVTGLNARTVWEWLRDGRTVGDICASVPDDFHGWIEDVAGEIDTAVYGTIEAAEAAHAGILKHLDAGADGAGWHRRDYAQLATESPDLAPYLFLLLDGNKTKAFDLAWRAAKPSGARSMINHTEAVA